MRLAVPAVSTATSSRDGNPAEARMVNAIEENMKKDLNARTVDIAGYGQIVMSRPAYYLAKRSAVRPRNRSRGHRERIGLAHCCEVKEKAVVVRMVSLGKVRNAICKHSTSLPSATEEIAMNIPTQTNDAESGISADSDEGASRHA